MNVSDEKQDVVDLSCDLNNSDAIEKQRTNFIDRMTLSTNHVKMSSHMALTERDRVRWRPRESENHYLTKALGKGRV